MPEQNVSNSTSWFRRITAVAVLCVAWSGAGAQTTLGSFTFSDGLFGSSLIESDGGAWSSGANIHTAAAIPTNPGYLTGVGFNTGIANINRITYTIGYGSGIFNNAGDDLGVVTARFSADTFDIAVSTDGTTFGAAQRYLPGSGIATGESRAYLFAGNAGRWNANLFIQPLDLSGFGLGAGEFITAVRITGYKEFDLIRVAGFDSAVEELPMTPMLEDFSNRIFEEGPTTVTPEPGTYALMAAGLAGLFGVTRRKRPTA